MKEKNEEKKAWGKALAISLAGGILLSCAFSSLKNQKETKKTLPSPEPKETTNIAQIDEDEEKKNKERTKKEAEQTKKGFIASTLIFLGSLLVKTVGILLTGVFSKLVGTPITGVVSFLFDVLTNLVTIMLLFALLFKRLYPERSLKELFTIKNILWMAGGSVLLSLMRLGFYFLGGKWYFLSVLAQSLFTIGTIVLLYYKTFDVSDGFGKFLGKMFFKDKGTYYLTYTLIFTVACALIRLAVRGLSLIGVYTEFVVFFVICLFVSRFALQILKPKKKIIMRENYYFEIDEDEDKKLLSSENA